MILQWACVAAALGVSVTLTAMVRRHALRTALLDIPNARSSHQVPTPRGGGVAIVISSLCGVVVLCALGVVELKLAIALTAGGLAVALAGYLDDRGKIGIRARITLHFFAAILAVNMVGGVRELHWGPSTVALGFAGDVLSVLGVVWALNLFNFMDGIDGIAASEATFVAVAGAGLSVLAGASGSVPMAAAVLAAASLGFLVWNWPPARIFMGDVGSGYLGFCVAVLALAAAREHPSLFSVWLVLSGIFVVDATLTLIRRLARRERVYEAHRSHAYQWLARRWGSHLRVTMLVNGLNILWLLPMAIGCIVRPELTTLWVASAMLPLCVLAFLAGAGRQER